MKNVVWILVVLTGLFASCQTSKPFTNQGAWGQYAGLPEPQPTAAETTQPKSGMAKSKAAVSSQNPQKPARYAQEPVLLASANGHFTLANPTKMVVSRNVAPADEPTPAPAQAAQGRQLHKLAVAGLAASALAFLPFVTGISLLFGLPLALAGAFLSRRAIKQISADRENYRGLALAKAGFGIALVVLGLLLLFGVAALMVG